MPQKPKANQTRQEYMSLCVSNMKSEGEGAKKAREICFAVWMGHKKKGKK